MKKLLLLIAVVFTTSTFGQTSIRVVDFDMKWENGKIVEMLCYYDNTSLNMEMAAQ